MASKKDTRNTDDEYEIQHFGFSSTEFISQFRNVYINRINCLNTDLEATIAQKLNLNDSRKETLHNEFLSLTELQTVKLDEHLNKFEDKVREFITIPSNIVLPEDEEQENNNDEESVEDLKRDIEKLEKQYIENKLLFEIYNKELQFLKKLEPLQENVSFVLGNMHNAPKISIYEKQKQHNTKMQKNINKVCLSDIATSMTSENNRKEKNEKCVSTDKLIKYNN